jgi:Cu(I)/Ag(I) efflux system membrane fusion protein
MGATVLARATSWPGESFKGRVQALLPEVDDVSRTFTVRAVLDNANRKLSPGMFVSLDISQPKGQPQLTVPNEAVIATGKRTVVIVAKDVGSFSITDVVTGGSVGDKTLILKGVDEGQSIVLSGQFLIDSEASLTGTETRMGGMATPAPGKAIGPTHHGEGKVESITKEEITISHGPIPTLQWGAMTMGFKVPAAGLPSNIAVGDNVVFEIQPIKDGAFEISTITPVANAAKMPAKPAGAAQ